ncbi:MAG: hypothetical protein L0Y64_08165, partial [Myxococcaceae bacterium]|nr:hypothetical protein [Myxococcaceae bacterium]
SASTRAAPGGHGRGTQAHAVFPRSEDTRRHPPRAGELGLSAVHLMEPGVKAMLPFRLEVR